MAGVRLVPLAGQFVNRSQEASFQADRLVETIRHASLLFALSAALNTLFLLSDARFWGTAHGWVAIPARLAVIAVSLVCWAGVKRAASFGPAQAWMVAWSCATTLAVALLVSSRSELALFVVLLLPLIMYLTVPGSFRTVLAGGIGSSVALYLGYVLPDPFKPTHLGLAIALVTLNVALTLVISRQNRVQRIEWAATRSERRLREKLAESRDMIERLFTAVPIPLAVVTEDGTLLRANDAWTGYYGIRPGDPARLPSIYLDPDKREALVAQLRRTGKVDEFETRMRRADGAVRDCVLTARPVRIGDQNAVVSGSVDITDRNQAEAELRATVAEYRALFDNAVVGIYRATFDGQTLRANPALARLAGYESEAEMLAASHDVSRELYVQPGRRLEFLRRMEADGRVTDFVSEIYRLKTGERIWVSETAWTVHDQEGRPAFIEGTVADATDRRQAEAIVEHMARHDALTDLPNRATFKARLTTALAGAAAGSALAVLYVDLDRFKSINDSLGHAAGDALLREVAERIRGELAAGDVAARFGGDEFAVLRASVADPADAQALGDRLIAAISAPIVLDGREMAVGASVGIAVQSGPAPADEVLRNADLALYRAKAGGRNSHRLFVPEMDAELRERRAIEFDLRHALSRGEFAVHFQPLLSLADDQVVGFEALLRWRHPERGFVLPEVFIPIAEETGAIVEIGAWVMREACRAAAGWPWHVRVSVNISSVQIQCGGLVAMVASALAGAGLHPSRLQVEITETALMRDDEASRAVVGHLRSLGVRVALDDFGTGYSSLSYLHRMAIDAIKIDRSFIAAFADPTTASIVRAIVDIGRQRGLCVTAEGIETREQLETVRREGCTEAQGFLIGRPAPSIELHLRNPRAAARRDVA